MMRGQVPFADTVVPLADCLSAIVHGDLERTTDGLVYLHGVEDLGGSQAQREAVEDALLYAAALAGGIDVAERVVVSRLDRRESPRERALLRRLQDDATRR